MKLMRGEARRSGARNRSKPKWTPEYWWTPAALVRRGCGVTECWPERTDVLNGAILPERR